MVIERTDRIAAVLGWDEQLIDVFVAASPIFERLRNPVLRKTMGRLTSVEQAARIAGIDPDLLTERLNRARKRAAAPAEEAPPAPAAAAAASALAVASVPAEAPPELVAIPEEKIVELDVREELRAGREPFSLIMAARREVPDGGALRLWAIFEPVPLYAVLGKQGFQHWAVEHTPDDWEVWFYPAAAAATAPAPTANPSPALEEEAGDGVVVLDVRGMDPPEPMVRTLAALETLPMGQTLLQINERIPRFLLPRLKEQGFTWEIREQEKNLVRIFIRRAD